MEASRLALLTAARIFVAMNFRPSSEDPFTEAMSFFDVFYARFSLSKL